jgi:hypothetical protein
MMLFNRDSAIQSASIRFCTVYKLENSIPCQPSRRRDIPSGCPSVQSIFRPVDENFPSRPSSVSRSFELLQLASFRTFHQHIRMPLSVRPALGFPSKTQLWEDHCNRPDDMDSRPNAIIHKEIIAFKIQTSECQSSWSGRTRSDMEITCIRSTVPATIPWVRTREALVWKLLAVQVRPFG